MHFMQLYPTQTKSIQLKASQATHSDKCDLLKPTHIPRRPCFSDQTLKLCGLIKGMKEKYCL